MALDLSHSLPLGNLCSFLVPEVGRVRAHLGRGPADSILEGSVQDGGVVSGPYVLSQDSAATCLKMLVSRPWGSGLDPECVRWGVFWAPLPCSA